MQTSNNILKIVTPSEVDGTITAPPSKSIAQRAIAIAAMADGNSLIISAGDCDDVLATIGVSEQFGVLIDKTADTLSIYGGMRPPVIPLQCRESGLCIRMFAAIAATFKEEITLTGKGSLLNRPMYNIEECLHALGVKCTTNKGRIPVKVKGCIETTTGVIDGSISSQLLTGLLIAAPRIENDLELQVNNLKSKQYIDLTIDVINKFGVVVENQNYQNFYVKGGQSYKPCIFSVEGDWSAAAFMLVAGAIAGKVTVKNLKYDSLQPDKAIIKALEEAGADILVKKDLISVEKKPLKAFEFNASHCPDLFPPLVALASNCDGESKITGIDRLVHKESNRADTLKNEFAKLNIGITFHKNTMIVKGGKCKGGIINSQNDHRIAMSCAVAALVAKNTVRIENPQVITKSYPSFFKDLKSLQKK